MASNTATNPPRRRWKYSFLWLRVFTGPNSPSSAKLESDLLRSNISIVSRYSKPLWLRRNTLKKFVLTFPKKDSGAGLRLRISSETLSSS
ncbi:hypothetical protein OGATHE_003692 [Ogataea polymorpha]|uniref:Uncharacterized protein n=1 Tax=Ogataea polymorpha TaxID=460523 RepID=A0A9P8P458_9ASCO|nr:hypothetical protein OGATHE_003692 [Ogataea polymorpha]